MAEDDFRPDGVRVQGDDTGQWLRIVFDRNDGTVRQVSFRREWLPTLLSVLQREIAPNQALPIDRASLRPGQDYVVHGYQLAPIEEGALLTLNVELPDQARSVTIPLRLSSDDVVAIIAKLAAILRG
jgi:hypothetical protein